VCCIWVYTESERLTLSKQLYRVHLSMNGIRTKSKTPSSGKTEMALPFSRLSDFADSLLSVILNNIKQITTVANSNLDQAEVYNIMWQVCQWLATGRWFSPGPPVCSTNKTDRHDINSYHIWIFFSAMRGRI
jgi:hypothetical protein